MRKAGEPVRSTKVKSEEKSQKKPLVTPYVPKLKRRNLFSPTNWRKARQGAVQGSHGEPVARKETNLGENHGDWMTGGAKCLKVL